MDFGLVRGEREGAAQRGLRFFEPPPLVLEHAEVVVDVGAPRRQPQRLLVSLAGRVRLLVQQQHVAEIAVPPVMLAVQRDGCANQRDRPRMVAALVRRQALEMQSLGMVRHCRKDALVALLGLVEPASLVQFPGPGPLQRRVECFVRGRGLDD